MTKTYLGAFMSFNASALIVQYEMSKYPCLFKGIIGVEKSLIDLSYTVLFNYTIMKRNSWVT